MTRPIPLTRFDGIQPGDRVLHIQRGRAGTVRSAASLDMAGDHAWNIQLEDDTPPGRVTAHARELAWAPGEDA